MRTLRGLLGISAVLAAVCIWGAGHGAAGVPLTISYQGYLTDSAGRPIDGQTDFTFTLYRADNSQVWTETIHNVVVTKGIYSVTLGEVSALSAVPFDEQYSLGIRAGTDPEMTPRQPLTSVGYAIRAAIADSAASGAVGSDSIATGAVTPAKLANVCAEGDFLVKTSGGWACSSSIPNLATTKRPWGCSADRSMWNAAVCASNCTADSISGSTCSSFCGNADLAALIAGGYSSKYCGR